MEHPVITKMQVIPVAGYDSMLMTLSGAHAPCFTRNLVILTDSLNHTGIGEIHGGDYTCDCLNFVRPLVEGQPIAAYRQILQKIHKLARHEPTDDGESPISKMTDWVNTTCPCCGGPAKRETDTMPQWAGSSWYYLRYMDPHDANAPVSKEAEAYWGPVDWYNGGMEHTTLHLLYSRFWHKFLYDIGVVPTKEPYAKRTSHGMILGEGGIKMSKSRGNVINPTDVIAEYGADTMRTYIMFIGDFEKAATWSNDAVKGSKRFLDRVWNLAESASDSYDVTPANEAVIHKTIKKVTEDVDSLKMNTAIAAMMTMVNELNANGCTRGDLKYLLLLLNPFAPHITEELWENLGFAAQTGKMCCQAEWPVADESKTVASTVELAVQVNGKLKGTISMPTDSEEKAVVDAALAVEKVRKATEGMQIIKTILVKNRLVNLIVKPAK